MTGSSSSNAGTRRTKRREIVVSTDQHNASEELLSRLDHVEGRRRRWYAVTASAAAAAVVVAVVVAAFVMRSPARTDSPLPASTHSSAPTFPYSNTSLTPTISLDMPSWTTHASVAGGFGLVNFDEADCAKLGGQLPCPAGQDLKLRLLSLTSFHRQDGSGAVASDPSYPAYLTYLDSLGTSGVVVPSDRASITVGGRPATVVSFAVKRDAPGGLACAYPTDPAPTCASLVAGRAARMAVVNQGAGVPPTVLYISLNGDARDRDERFAEFDTMLTTVTFG